MKSVLIAAASALLLGATSLHAAPQDGGRINVVVQPEPPGLMLGIVQNGPASLVAGEIYESLVKYDDKLKPMPSLAKSWEISTDGLTYTFHLQDNVKFHDGVPMTADDVLFSVNEFLPKTLAKHRNTMTRVESVTAPDAKTIVFKLKAPFEPFIRSMDFGAMPIIPKHLYAGTDYTTNPNNDKPIGTGPFKFAEWKKGSYIKLVKNQDYYIKGLPHLDEIYYQVIPDAAARAVAYETGAIDVLPGGSVENFDVPRVSGLPNTCMTQKGWEFYSPLSWMWINNRSKPMDNPKFRQAIMFAMDREFAKDVLWNGLGKVANGAMASTQPFFTPGGPEYPHDPAKAKALLKEIGYDGKPIRLLPLPYGETWQRWAEAVKQNLEEVGIPVNIESTDVAGWGQRISNWDYDLAFTYLFQNGDPAIGVDRNYKANQIAKGSPWNNVEGYANPELDQLFEKAALAFPADARRPDYDKAQEILRRDVPVAWLLELGFPTIYNCKVQDLVSTGTGLPDSLRNAWIKK
jgi:peptide/nickel transport system substrate-binding protein